MNIAFASSLTGSLAVDIVVIAVAAVAAAALLFYRRPRIELSRAKRVTLIALRASALALVLALLLRPVAFVAPLGARRCRRSDPRRRLAEHEDRRRRRAVEIRSSEVDRAIRPRAGVVQEVPHSGDRCWRRSADAAVTSLDAHARRSDLAGAVARVRDRFRGQRLAGIVLISDGADTGLPDAPQPTSRGSGAAPVFAIGAGSTTGLHDREVLSIAAGEQRLADASIDVRVSASSVGMGRAPYAIRLRANGSVVDTRRVAPAADGSTDHVTFTVVPDASRDTIYTAEIPVAQNETIAENNARGVLVSAAGRKRRLLIVAGAPGFEHSFMTRAWSLDAGLEVDSVVRKGKNGEGRDTFVIQAGRDRAQSLAAGFPSRREDLDAYDAVVIANIEGSFFTHEQLTMLADFVSKRGGGLLVAGSRSLAQRGLLGTPLEPLLPVELDDRRGTVARAALGDIGRTPPNHVAVTADGATHPIMRLGASGDDTRMRWAALPALAASTPLGQPRAGASVLAVVAAPDGGVFPVVAVQKYGRGRSMVFGGEASWRWRMLAPSTDRSHELFWRQAARWLSQSSPDPVSISVADVIEPGDTAEVGVDAHDASFALVSDATVSVSASIEGEASQTLPVHRDGAGRFVAPFVPEGEGIYRVHVDARRGSTALGSADRAVYVGGSDREFADPRLNEGFLRRLAADSGGRYVQAADASRVLSWLDDSARQATAQQRRDVWDRGPVFVAVVLLLSVEWTLRRRWGLR